MRAARTFRLLMSSFAIVAIGAAAGCGGGENLIPADRASTFDSALQQVADATRAGDCQQATDALRSAQRAYAALPASVDDRLTARLRDGLEQLVRTVPTQCREAAGQTQTTTTSTAPTTTTTEPATTTTTTTTTEPTTTTTAPPATTTTTTPTTTDPNGGITPGEPTGADPGASP